MNLGTDQTENNGSNEKIKRYSQWKHTTYIMYNFTKYKVLLSIRSYNNITKLKKNLTMSFFGGDTGTHSVALSLCWDPEDTGNWSLSSSLLAIGNGLVLIGSGAPP